MRERPVHSPDRRIPRTSRVGATLLLGVLGVPLAACGAAEDATSRAVERIVSDAAAREGVDLDFDLDDDGEGTVVIRSEDGEVVASTGADVPADLPSNVPIPSGWDAIASSRIVDGTTTLWTVTFDTRETVAAAVERFGAGLGAGFEQTVSQFNDSGEGASAFVIWEGPTLLVAASAAGSASGETQVTLSITDEPAQRN